MRLLVFARSMLAVLLCLVGVLLAASASGQVHLDLSGAQVEVHGPEGLRINHLKVPGYPGIYWVDLQWDPMGLTFVAVAYGAEAAVQPVVILHSNFMGAEFIVIESATLIDYEAVADKGSACALAWTIRNITANARSVALLFNVLDGNGIGIGNTLAGTVLAANGRHSGTSPLVTPGPDVRSIPCAAVGRAELDTRSIVY